MFTYILRFLVLVCLPLSAELKFRYEVSVVAIFQNEDRFLKEWIEFHKTVGVQHFYLYNHLSTDDYQSVLEPYIQDGTVELIDWPYPFTEYKEWGGIQMQAYKDGIKRARKISKWVAIIDTDEFLFPVQAVSLSEFLEEYEEYAALGVNWQCYGSSYIERLLPEQYMLEVMTWKAPQEASKNFHVKSIVQPLKVVDCDNPHYCRYKENEIAVNESKKPFEGAFTEQVEISKIRINHYWSRDLDFLINNKLVRQRKWTKLTEDEVMRADREFNQVEDTAIYPWLEKMKESLKSFELLQRFTLSIFR